MFKWIKQAFIVIVFFIFNTCGTALHTEYFYDKRDTYETVIDSLSKEKKLIIPATNNWSKIEYFSGDSVIVSTYYYTGYIADTLYVFSITEDPISGYIIKYRKEWRGK